MICRRISERVFGDLRLISVCKLLVSGIEIQIGGKSCGGKSWIQTLLGSALEEQQVLESEWTVPFRREQITLAARVDVGEHSFLGIPGVEACPGLGFNKETLGQSIAESFGLRRLVFHWRAADRTRKVLLEIFSNV